MNQLKRHFHIICDKLLQILQGKEVWGSCHFVIHHVSSFPPALYASYCKLLQLCCYWCIFHTGCITVFACSSEHSICIFSALFQRSGNFADLYTLLCYTRRAYLPEKKKKKKSTKNKRLSCNFHADKRSWILH